jgi:hypothetical protein
LTTLWLVVIALLALWGYYSSVTRLVGYAALFLAALLASIWLHLPIYLLTLVLGMVICTSGLVVAARFVHGHPKLAQD